VRLKARRNQLRPNLPHGIKTKPDMLKNGEQSVVQWRKPGPQFGGTKKNFAVPQIQKFQKLNIK